MSRLTSAVAQLARGSRVELSGTGRSRVSATLAAAIAIALSGSSACAPEIGDPCLRGIECSQQGERSCDLSYRVDADGNLNPEGDGECIIEGCAAGSCPNEAVCVRVFGVKFLSIPCDPDKEDQYEGFDDCLPNEVCLDEGLCVDANTARATCRRSCGDDDDCRNGYVCRQTGANGVYAVPEPDDPETRRLERICVPRGY